MRDHLERTVFSIYVFPTYKFNFQGILMFPNVPYYLPNLARSLKWCIVIALKTCGHHFVILKPQASRLQDLLWQSLLLMQTEINYVQHVSQISLQFIVGQWCDISISKVNCDKLSCLLFCLQCCQVSHQNVC